MVDRLCKGNEAKNKVKKILSNYEKSFTSNYSKMEFKKGFLQNLIYLHGKVSNSKSLADVYEAISKLSSTPKRNLLGTVLEALHTFYRYSPKVKVSDIHKKYGDITPEEYQKEMIESFLNLLIQRSWTKFDNLVDEMINPTKCFVDIQPPEKKNNIFNNKNRTCDKSMKECEIRKFFNDNYEIFSKILQKLKEIDDPDTETKNRTKSLKTILRVPKRSVIEKDCWKCGDAIMSVEAPEDSDIFNNNQKHFTPICEAIGKSSVGYNT